MVHGERDLNFCEITRKCVDELKLPKIIFYELAERFGEVDRSSPKLITPVSKEKFIPAGKLLAVI